MFFSMRRGWKIILYEELKWLEVTKNAEKKELSWREIDYGPMGDTLIFFSGVSVLFLRSSCFFMTNFCPDKKQCDLGDR